MSTVSKTEIKYVHSLKIVKMLVEKGFEVVKVEPAERGNGFLVYGFEKSPELLASFNEIIGGGK